MVKVLDVEKTKFLNLLLHKKLICFGMGKCLQRFIKQNPDIFLDGIVDNYTYEQTPYLNYEGRNIPVWSVEQFEKSIVDDNKIIIVVTSLAIEEIVDQLDKIEKLNNVPCCIEVALDGYELPYEIRPKLMKVVSCLAQRTEDSIIKENFEEANKNQKKKKFQIWEYFGASNIGGSKARTDIKSITGTMGYQVIKLHTTVGEEGTSMADCSDRLVRKDWLQCLNTVLENSYILMQHPTPRETRLPEDILWRIKREKNAQIICLVHEVEVLRKAYDTKLRRQEFQIMKSLADVFIVHNEVMRCFYIEQGIDADRVISLQIFDYLNEKENIDKVYEKSVTIAANLSLEKSPYLKKLKELSPLKIHMYGPNFSKEISEGAENIEYHGSIDSDELPEMLNRGFGLVWDGESLDTCSGGCGEYLRYNNPHKLSLYLSSGLPVIIWSQAAEADFVLKNKIGITIDSLYEVNTILDGFTLEEYAVLAENAKKISNLLKNGEFTKRAVKMAESYLESGGKERCLLI